MDYLIQMIIIIIDPCHSYYFTTFWD